MNQIFNNENFFFRGVSKVLELLGLSLLWILFSIPVVTAGAATAALYYTVNKTVKNERGYIFQQFFSAFAENFKQATIVWLILLVAFAVLGADYYIMLLYAQAGYAIAKFRFVFLVMAIIILMWSLYIFPYIARFDDSTKNVLKNTAILAFGHAPLSLAMMALFCFMCVIIYKLTPVIIVLPASYNLLKNYFIEKIFVKYMSEEDKELEEERNRVYYN